MTELIWNSKKAGTAVAPSGASTTIGEDANFEPEDLLAMAVTSCLMRTFLQLAADEHIPVLSYAATARVERWSEGWCGHVDVYSYVVGPEDVNQGELKELLKRAARWSPMCRLVGEHLTHHTDVRPLCGARAA